MRVQVVLALGLWAGITGGADAAADGPGSRIGAAADPDAASASTPQADFDGKSLAGTWLVGTWRVTGVAVMGDGVQALIANDPAYMGREVVVGPRRIAWKAGAANVSATVDDVCTGFTLRRAAPAGEARDDRRLEAAALRGLAIRPRAAYAIDCASGSWGPAAAGAVSVYPGSRDLIAMPWYDNGMLKLERVE